MMRKDLTNSLRLIIPFLAFLAALCGCRDGVVGSPPADADVLENSFSSVEDLTGGFLAALREGDLEKLRLIAADREEFENLIWPYLPASKPNTNLTAEFVWEQSQIKSLTSLRSTMERYRDSDVSLKAVELNGGVREYGKVRLYMEPEVVVSINGVEQRRRLFGSIMQLDGEYKIYSYSL